MIFLLVQICMWCLMYGAFILGLDGPARVLAFLAWAMAVLTPFGLADASIKRVAAKPPAPAWQPYLSWPTVWTLLVAFVWFDYPVTAIAWAVGMACSYSAGQQARKMRGSGS